MKAAVQIEDQPLPCVVYWVGRKGLSVRIISWCGNRADASDGTIQIPDDAKVCTTCETQIKIGKPKV